MVAIDNRNLKLIESLSDFIKANAISEEIVDAAKEIDRKYFVPLKYLDKAYEESQIPLIENYFMQPTSVYLLIINMAKIRPGLNVLEIGSNTGYSTAIIANIVGTEGKVTSIERSLDLHNFAKKNVTNIQKVINKKFNVEFVYQDVSIGYWNNGPYDVIVSFYSSSEVPREFVQQLKVDGRAVVPLGNANSNQIVTSYDKLTNTIYTKPITVRFPKLK
ncbi:MAG: methyltransferase domain-containing protein [Candidatus Anstonellales archaeon]